MFNPFLQLFLHVSTSKIFDISGVGDFLNFSPFEMMSLRLLFKRVEPVL